MPRYINLHHAIFEISYQIYGVEESDHKVSASCINEAITICEMWLEANYPNCVYEIKSAYIVEVSQ